MSYSSGPGQLALARVTYDLVLTARVGGPLQGGWL